VRARHEYIDQDGREERNRQRVRARLNVGADVNENVKAVIGAISGGDDPASGNQTLDTAFSSKGLQLNLAYVEWAVTDDIDLIGGKMKQPWVVVSDLVWDGDVNPEGFVGKVALGEDVSVSASVGFFYIDEISDTTEDVTLTTGQVALHAGPLTFGGSIFDYENVAGSPAVFDDDLFGNTGVTLGTGDDAVEVFAEDFQIVEGFAQAKCKAGDLPVKIYGQVAVNADDASGEDTAYLVGVKVGKAKEPGQVEVEYNYRDVEANAVFGTLSDSDFIGGGTNGEGSKIKGKVAIARNWIAGATLFLTQIDPNGADTDYRRVQLDLVARF